MRIRVPFLLTLVILAAAAFSVVLVACSGESTAESEPESELEREVAIFQDHGAWTEFRPLTFSYDGIEYDALYTIDKTVNEPGIKRVLVLLHLDSKWFSKLWFAQDRESGEILYEIYKTPNLIQSGSSVWTIRDFTQNQAIHLRDDLTSVQLVGLSETDFEAARVIADAIP